MAEESLEGLGFDPNAKPQVKQLLNPSEKEKTGFIAGLTIKPVLVPKPNKTDS